jgi:DNA repair exonuclease SbcCD ATPase subunit
MPVTWPDMDLTPQEQMDKLAKKHPTVEAQLKALHAEMDGLLARPREIEEECARLHEEMGPIENRRRAVDILIKHLQGVRSVR